MCEKVRRTSCRNTRILRLTCKSVGSEEEWYEKFVKSPLSCIRILDSLGLMPTFGCSVLSRAQDLEVATNVFLSVALGKLSIDGIIPLMDGFGNRAMNPQN